MTEIETTVPALLEKLLTPEEEELHRKQANLADLESRLADRELELAACLADLNHFEKRYLQTVGRRYAILDELRAKIAEARAQRNPSNSDAKATADRARTTAHESARAAGEHDSDTTTPNASESPSPVHRSESLNKLYRQAARLLHPDLTLDGDEKKRRHHLMAELNDAYTRGDEERVQAILRDWHASPENVQGDGPGAELIRVIRKIAQVEKRLKTIAAELERVGHGELFKLKRQVEEAQVDERDLLADLAQRIDSEIDQCREKLKHLRTHGAP